MSAVDNTKRVFMTMGDSSDFLKKPEKNAGTGGSKSKTLRLDLDLFEPDEYKFPEFNYKNLVHIEKKKQKKLAKLPNGNHEGDPFNADNDGDVERIARELEAKYGGGSSYAKSSRLTTVDRGAGYDASDTFIDDTEAYDELIPDEIETDRGGFYINSGALEFKKLSNYERPGDEIRMPKAKKRALSTSSESSESEAEEKAEAEKTKKKNHAEKKVKTATTSSSDEQGKAKKAKKEKVEKPEKPKEVPKEVQPVKEPEKKKPVEKEPEKVLKTTTVKDMLRAKRDNMRKIEQGKTTSSGTTTADDDDGESESVSSLAVSESSRDSHPEAAPENGVKEISLPENLPAAATAIIASLKLHAETAVSAKTNFFNSQILDQLVMLDDGVKVVSMNARLQTFNYLVQFVPCAKKTLFARVRKHRVQQVEHKVKAEINKLRKIVSEAMPNEIARHEQDMKLYETKKNIQNVVGDTSFEHSVPRKKFHWTDATRLVLYNITVNLQELFKGAKTKNEIYDDFLLRKMRDDVIPLWPEGWIKVEELRKELERKKKKEVKAASTSQGAPQVQTKPNTASATASTNGKTSTQAQKTETVVKNSDVEVAMVNGKSSQKSSLPTPNASATSVIKRSSDHSINSIISASPSPPTTSHSAKLPEVAKKLEKLASELIKGAPPKQTVPKFNSASAISVDLATPDKEKVRRSDSSDSDCVEVVGEFCPIKPVKSVFHHNNNNNKANASSTSHHAPVAKKSKKHGSDDGEHETDYSKIIMGIQSLTDTKKSTASSFLMKSPLSSPVSLQQHQRKAETSHGVYDSNGTGDHFLDPKLPPKSFNHTNNLHYSIGDLIANRVSHDGTSVIKTNVKSSDLYKSTHHYNHQQQLTSSTNNNLHSISLSLTPPSRQSPHQEPAVTYMLPSILNLSKK